MSDDTGRPMPGLHVDPLVFADMMPRRPIATSDRLNWRDLTIQRYSLTRGAFDVPPATHWRLGMHTGGPLKVEARYGGDRHGQRWLQQGHFNLVPAAADAHWEFLGKPELLLVHLSTALFDEVIADIDPHGGPVSLAGHLAVADETVLQLSRLLLAEAQAGNPGSRLFADGLSRALAIHLLRRYSSSAVARREAKPAALGGRIGRVIDFIQASYADDLSLDQLSEVGGLSPSTFARAFRAQTGLTPHRFLIKVRIAIACDLLERTAIPVTEVGMRCGFGQPSHFSTMFRQTLGMTPREYRHAHRA